ncbi:hypothetical protein [Cupriavidus basilensis]
MNSTLDHYFEALSRLKARGAKINNDAVALEAGRKKGSIKKGRPQFAKLISEIESAANASSNDFKSDLGERLEEAKKHRKDLQTQLDAALLRELSLLREVFQLKKELVSLRGGNVIPIRDR